ncbi:hypothetical protein [Aestuariicoccus sp. MJ-SS9]|uniref:hypothetical protein n=1 Tax=Aestuariicoccus sp. MJ-SS9 TaxID=3079855 RepID=UPI002910E507|nr:hypothetical protein [Aestuariicoccus sp. MJ-SS9]MDU8912581.1 hypothetical protein [Aestuariicoccus sp. MJ-SS9]
MDPDTSLVMGLAIAVLSVPAMVSAMSDGRSPRAAAVALILGGGLMVYAVQAREGGYRIDEVPTAIYRVIAKFTG